MISTSKRVMSMAHSIQKSFHDLETVAIRGSFTWSDCLTDAWKIQRVRQALNKGVLNLCYYKGLELQFRRGTLSAAYIPGDRMPKGIREQEIEQGLTKENWGVINYYDLDKQGWRSFKITHLVRAIPIEIEIKYSTKNYGESIYDK